MNAVPSMIPCASVYNPMRLVVRTIPEFGPREWDYTVSDNHVADIDIPRLCAILGTMQNCEIHGQLFITTGGKAFTCRRGDDKVYCWAPQVKQLYVYPICRVDADSIMIYGIPEPLTAPVAKPIYISKPYLESISTEYITRVRMDTEPRMTIFHAGEAPPIVLPFLTFASIAKTRIDYSAKTESTDETFYVNTPIALGFADADCFLEVFAVANIMASAASVRCYKTHPRCRETTSAVADLLRELGITYDRESRIRV